MKSIVYCVLDTLDNAQHTFARDVSINLADSLICSLIKKHYDVFIGTSEKELLTQAANSNFYSHAVIISTGTSSLFSSDNLINKIKEFCKNDFFIAGHILDRQSGYFELHKQFYIVRLKDYADLGFPEIAEGSFMEEHIHTQLAPAAIFNEGSSYVVQDLKKGNIPIQYNRKHHGWDLLTTAINNDKIVIDIGADIRFCKEFFYPEYDHVFLNSFSKIHFLQFFCYNFFAAWNTDMLHRSIEFEGPVEQYITVGVGLHWINNLNTVGFTEDTKVIFTDINSNFLEFTKKLIDEWDGDDYLSFYESHLPIIPDGAPVDILKYSKHADKEFQNFKGLFDDWPSLWNKIKKLKFEFVLVDYTSYYTLRWMSADKKTLINLSNLFNFEPFSAIQGVKYRIAAENKLIKKLQDLNPDMTLIVTSRAGDGFDTRLGYKIAKVKDFTLTDINELKKLPWHEEDWVHTGPRFLGI